MDTSLVTQLGLDDLDNLVDLAEEFYSSSQFLNGFDKEISKRSWTNFIAGGTGAIFAIKEDDAFHGMLGVVKFPDINTGELIACEMFWFVSKEHRGKGLLLVNAFEEWAKQEGCKKVAIAHLEDSMPDSLEKLYVRMGYTLSEKTYIKEVS